MYRRLILPVVFVVLGYGFWISPTLKEIAAGIAIFLFGMLCMEEGFKAFSGGAMERVLRRSTARRWQSLTFGIVTTTLMQSSSLVSVITISFLSAGLLGLAQGIGIIFGANLGTTTGAWIVAGFGLKVNLATYALPMLVFGVLLIFQQHKRLKGAGWVLAGFGFLFLGIHYMKEGFSGYADSLDLTQFALEGIAGLAVYTLLGLLATVVMQSSHATLVLIITALGAGQITYENALALAIGSNIGTTVTAVIGALGAPVEGKRLAGAHLIFNLGTGMIALAAIQGFVLSVDWISERIGIAADDYTLKLAVFHTLFNLVGVVVFLPLVDRLVGWLERALKGEKMLHDAPRYLSDAALELPHAALIALRRETAHLFQNAFTLIAHGVNLRRSKILSDDDLQDLIEESGEVIDIDIDGLYELTIKDVYSANVLFYSKAIAKANAETAPRLQSLWQANLDIVAAIKATKHLRKNLNRHSRSSNQYVRKEYNRFRVRVGELMRDLETLRDDDADELTILSLDSIKLGVKDSHMFNDRVIDALIREGLVPPQMATSMMNDYRYVEEIMHRLINMAERMLDSTRPLDSVTDDLALTADEIAEIADAPPDEATLVQVQGEQK
jgi:phosphate:Na+ symporter